MYVVRHSIHSVCLTTLFAAERGYYSMHARFDFR